MTFILQTKNGEYQLPAPLRFTISQSCGLPCGHLSLMVGYDERQGSVLRETERIRVEENGTLLFCGVLDDWSVSTDGIGKTCSLSGRSLQALLLDQTAVPVQFSRCTWADLTSRFVTPLGLPVEGAEVPAATDFRVESGRNVWQVLNDFLTMVGGGLPWVSPEGKVCVRSYPAGEAPKYTLSKASPVLSQRFGFNRYDVVTQYTVRNRDTKQEVLLKNPEYAGPGGRKSVVTAVGAQGMADWQRDARQAMQESLRNLITGRVTLAGGFCAAAGDVIDVKCEDAPFAGKYRVWVSETSCDAGGLTTTLQLVWAKYV